MFAKQRTDICSVCEDCYKANIALTDMLKKLENERTEEDNKKIQELRKVVFAGMFHKEQNENWNHYPTAFFN